MFKNIPNILAHKSSCEYGNFVLLDNIIINNNGDYSLKNRDCPHRGYTMHNPGDVVKEVVCKLHGFCWDQNGDPLNKEPYVDHFYKLHHLGDVTLGGSGLLFQNFIEPIESSWYKILSKDKDLQFNKTITGKSTGSWLWLMEQMCDSLHVRPNGVHPRQSLETPLGGIEYENGDNWLMQIYPTSYGAMGFWLYIYPGCGIEYEPGKLTVTRVVPDNINNEYGLRWEIQFYYAPHVDAVEREAWEKCIEVYYEDIVAIENINRPYFPLKRPVNKYEFPAQHWGEWFLKNK